MFRKIQHWLAIGALLVFIMFMFASSEAPLPPLFQNTFIEKLLVSRLTGNDIVFGLSMGIIVSSIFYLLVVFFPEQRKKLDIAPQIELHVTGVISRIRRIVSNIITHSGIEINLETLTEEKFVEACGLVNPKEVKQRFSDGGGRFFENNLGFGCYGQWELIQININDIMHFLPYVDTGMVKILNEIRRSEFALTAKTLRDVERLSNSDMSAWASAIYELLELSNKLEKHYRRHVNSKIKL